MRDLAYGLVRVLDEEGTAVGPWSPQLDASTLRRALNRCCSPGCSMSACSRATPRKTSFYMKSTGEEAIACAQAMVLNARDMFFPTYRVQGILIARGIRLLS